QLGYRANTQAQALRRGRTPTYGLGIPNFSNPSALEVRTGADRAASDAGAPLLLLDSHYSAEREHLLVREMAAQRLAGLAIAPVGKGESLRLWQELRPGTPAVALNAAVEGIPGVSRVYPDNAAGVELAMRRLAEVGPRGGGRTRDAAAGRARALVRGVPVGAARPGGRPGPAAPFPAAGAGARRAAGRDALTAHHHRRAQGGRDAAGPPGCPSRGPHHPR